MCTQVCASHYLQTTFWEYFNCSKCDHNRPKKMSFYTDDPFRIRLPVSRCLFGCLFYYKNYVLHCELILRSEPCWDEVDVAIVTTTRERPRLRWVRHRSWPLESALMGEFNSSWTADNVLHKAVDVFAKRSSCRSRRCSFVFDGTTGWTMSSNQASNILLFNAYTKNYGLDSYTLK